MLGAVLDGDIVVLAQTNEGEYQEFIELEEVELEELEEIELEELPEIELEELPEIVTETLTNVNTYDPTTDTCSVVKLDKMTTVAGGQQ